MKESQLKELVNEIVKVALSELDSLDMSSGMGNSGTPTDPAITGITNPTDPVQQQKAKLDQKKQTHTGITKLTKQLRFRDNQKQAQDKMFRIQKRDMEKQINAMKTGLNAGV